MSWQRKAHGGLLGFIGFMLSPLSWWNDAFVNLPLAFAFAWVVALPYRPAFIPAAIVGYWLTNILGLFLMHKGAQEAFGKDAAPSYTWPRFTKDLLISLAYTGLILLLVYLKVLQPISDYFLK